MLGILVPLISLWVVPWCYLLVYIGFGAWLGELNLAPTGPIPGARVPVRRSLQSMERYSFNIMQWE